jgi:hypothetical protein
MKLIFRTLITSIIVLLVVYLTADYAVNKIADRLVTELKPRLKDRGILVQHFKYQDVKLASFNSISIGKIELVFDLNKEMYGKSSFQASFGAETIILRFTDFQNPYFYISIHNFSLFVEPDEPGTESTFGKLQHGNFKSTIPLYLHSPEESAHKLLAEVRRLFHENKTVIDIEVEVDVLLGIDEKSLKVGLFSERSDDWTHLEFDVDDLIAASRQIDLELTRQEASIIARYPLKVPAMIKITQDARHYSQIAKVQDPSFPEDAFRHVYWSFQLTKALGPELSKQITNAHETAPGNTEAERLMDYHNNEIGRKYALENRSIDEIKALVLESDEIRRNPYLN